MKVSILRTSLVLLAAGGACVPAAAADEASKKTPVEAPHVELFDDAQSPDFAQVDSDNDQRITRNEAGDAGLLKLLAHWSQADTDHDGFIGAAELEGFRMAAASDQPPQKDQPDKDEPHGRDEDAPLLTIGKGQLKSPETALWDPQQDVYLVSNINGKLTDIDDNGFISRISPDGKILDLEWIKGKDNPAVVLNGPKGMLLTKRYLVVADVHTVRFFDRNTGDPLHAIPVKGSYMLNDPAVGPDGETLYVTDTGGKVDPPGAVYRLSESGGITVAEGKDLERPDGLIAYQDGLLVTPFGKHAKDVYQLGLDGKRRNFASMPAPQLDGLLQLPDGSLLVTSWKGDSVYRLRGGKPSTVASGIPTPAQIGYDASRQRLLVPVLRENELRIYPLAVNSR